MRNFPEPRPPPLLNQRINSFAAEGADCPDLIFAPTVRADRPTKASHCFEQQSEGVPEWTGGKGTVVVGGGEAMGSKTEEERFMVIIGVTCKKRSFLKADKRKTGVNTFRVPFSWF